MKFLGLLFTGPLRALAICPALLVGMTPVAVSADLAPSRAAPVCIDSNADESARAEEPLAARASLRTLLADAARRSQAVGAARLLADAAADDLAQTRAGSKPQASLGLGVEGAGQGAEGLPTSTGAQTRGNVSLTAPLYDAGQLDRLADWREHLLHAAQEARLSAEEQVALQTLALAIDRSRYAAQGRIYDQYRGKMACLVNSLEQIVRADRGRASELVQARKSLQQVELARDDTAAQAALTDIRLRRYTGGTTLPPAGDLATLLEALPAVPLVQADAARSPDLRQLALQAEAQDSLARATQAGQKPQASWVVSGSRAIGAGSSWGVSAGVNLTVPLLDPGADAALQAARRRATAARATYEDAIEARQSRVAEVHAQAQAAFDRARRIVDVLANSNRVRNDTLLQWQQLGRRSLFDVMAAEGDHYNLRLSRINALHDGEQAAALLWSLGRGVVAGLE